ncbi:Ig-like domain-containing protein, partial [Mycobacterium tuberculosis]
MTSTASFSITITPVNDRPTAGDQDLVTAEDTAKPVVLTAVDIDSSVSFTVTQAPGLGTLSGTPPNLVYTPLPNANGDDAFVFTVSDGEF